MSADGLRDVLMELGDDAELTTEGRMGVIRLPLSRLEVLADPAQRRRVTDRARRAGLTHVAVEIPGDDPE